MPAAVKAAALSFNAGAEVSADVLLVATFCETVRSPLLVVTATVPVELIPLYSVPPTVTCPIVNAVLLSTLRVPMEVPEAMVDKVLDALLSVQLPVPNSASPEDAPEITPLRVTSPVPPKEVAAASVTAPDAVAAVPLELTSAPLLPPPLKFMALATVLPFKSHVPPLTVTVPLPTGPLVMLPDVLTPAMSVPAFTVVPPLYVLAPLKVSVPAPVLVTAPVPEITPAKLVVPVELVKVPLRAIASAPNAAP